MGSTDKYPHGLNRWVEDNIPLMEDFNRDNELLATGAMWVSDYDAGGAIGQVGIAAYVATQVAAALSAQADTIAVLQGQVSALSEKVTALESQERGLETRVEALEHPPSG